MMDNFIVRDVGKCNLNNAQNPQYYEIWRSWSNSKVKENTEVCCVRGKTKRRKDRSEQWSLVLQSMLDQLWIIRFIKFVSMLLKINQSFLFSFWLIHFLSVWCLIQIQIVYFRNLTQFDKCFQILLTCQKNCQKLSFWSLEVI